VEYAVPLNEEWAARYDGEVDVHDGDTVWLTADQSQTVNLGFGEVLHLDPSRKRKYRLARVNAPELKTGAPGAAARQFVVDWLAANAAGLRIKVIGLDNYGGRWDTEVFNGTNNLSDALLASGNAVKYP
jgi:endonuclease YncB( thermonuclease family)